MASTPTRTPACVEQTPLTKLVDDMLATTPDKDFRIDPSIFSSAGILSVIKEHVNVPSLPQETPSTLRAVAAMNTNELVSEICKGEDFDFQMPLCPKVELDDEPNDEPNDEPKKTRPRAKIDPITGRRRYDRKRYRETLRRNNEFRSLGLEVPCDADGGKYYARKTPRKYVRSGRHRNPDPSKRRRFRQHAELYNQCSPSGRQRTRAEFQSPIPKRLHVVEV